MPKSIILPFVLLSLAIGISSCEKCEECAADLSARFRFVDINRDEIFADQNELIINDFSGLTYPALREATETDTFYIIDLRPQSVEFESPDTLLFRYSGALIDTVDVQYTFSSDSRCCKNTLTVNRLNFLNRDVARVLKPEFNIFDVIIE